MKFNGSRRDDYQSWQRALMVFLEALPYVIWLLMFWYIARKERAAVGPPLSLKQTYEVAMFCMLTQMVSRK